VIYSPAFSPEVTPVRCKQNVTFQYRRGRAQYFFARAVSGRYRTALPHRLDPDRLRPRCRHAYSTVKQTEPSDFNQLHCAKFRRLWLNAYGRSGRLHGLGFPGSPPRSHPGDFGMTARTPTLIVHGSCPSVGRKNIYFRFSQPPKQGVYQW